MGALRQIVSVTNQTTDLMVMSCCQSLKRCKSINGHTAKGLYLESRNL